MWKILLTIALSFGFVSILITSTVIASEFISSSYWANADAGKVDNRIGVGNIPIEAELENSDIASNPTPEDTVTPPNTEPIDENTTEDLPINATIKQDSNDGATSNLTSENELCKIVNVVPTMVTIDDETSSQIVTTPPLNIVPCQKMIIFVESRIPDFGGLKKIELIPAPTATPTRTTAQEWFVIEINDKIPSAMPSLSSSGMQNISVLFINIRYPFEETGIGFNWGNTNNFAESPTLTVWLKKPSSSSIETDLVGCPVVDAFFFNPATNVWTTKDVNVISTTSISSDKCQVEIQTEHFSRLSVAARLSSSVTSSGPSSVTSSGPSSVTSSGPSSGPSSVTSSGPSSVTSSGPSSVTSSGPSSVTSSGPSSGSTESDLIKFVRDTNNLVEDLEAYLNQLFQQFILPLQEVFYVRFN